MAEKTTAFTGPVVVGLNDKKGEIRLTDGKNVNEAKYLSIAAPDTITSDTTLTFPNGAGTAGQILSTDGNGTLSWVNDSAVILQEQMVKFKQMMVVLLEQFQKEQLDKF